MPRIDPEVMDWIAQAVPGVRELVPYQPGKPLEELERELGVRGALKLASNENPLGASPAAVDAVHQAVTGLAEYPDGDSFRLRHALAARHGVDPSAVTVGNGSNDVLDLIARAFLGPGREAVFSEYAFAVYPIVTRAVGATARVTKALDPDAGQPYGHDLEAMAGQITSETRVVFIANPNNPTGTWVDTAAVRRFLDALPGEVLCVVDEAYFEYVEDPDYPDTTQWLACYPNLVVTRTFSKVYGLARLRVGYGLSDPAVAELLNRVRQPFNVNGLAQAAALAALDDVEHVKKSVEFNSLGLGRLGSDLRERGIGFVPSVANFLCVDIGREAGPVYEGLLREGVIVRPLVAYGLPRFLRVTIGTADQNRQVVAALDQVLGL